MDQQIEHLRLHRNQFAAAAQFAQVGVENMIIEVQFHVRFRIFSQEEIKSVSRTNQAMSKVFLPHLLQGAGAKLAISALAESIS